MMAGGVKYLNRGQEEGKAALTLNAHMTRVVKIGMELGMVC